MGFWDFDDEPENIVEAGAGLIDSVASAGKVTKSFWDFGEDVAEKIKYDELNPIDAIRTNNRLDSLTDHLVDRATSSSKGYSKDGQSTPPPADIKERYDEYRNTATKAALFGEPLPEDALEPMWNFTEDTVDLLKPTTVGITNIPRFRENERQSKISDLFDGTPPYTKDLPSIITVRTNTGDPVNEGLAVQHENDHDKNRLPRYTIQPDNSAMPQVWADMSPTSLKDNTEYYGNTNEVSARLKEIESIKDMLSVDDSLLDASVELQSLYTEIAPFLDEYAKLYPDDDRVGVAKQLFKDKGIK